MTNLNNPGAARTGSHAQKENAGTLSKSARRKGGRYVSSYSTLPAPLGHLYLGGAS
jgi:hypothetical protein